MLHVVHDCGLGFNESVGEKALLVKGSVVLFFTVNFCVCVRAMCVAFSGQMFRRTTWLACLVSYFEFRACCAALCSREC